MRDQNSLGDAGARRQQLHQLLASQPPAESECALYLPRLAEYIDAQLAGEEYLSRFAEVAGHLDSCLSCADSYARLYELELALVTEALPAPKSLPVADLSFLMAPASAPSASPLPSLLDLIANALTTTAETIRLQLSADLLAFLQPPPSAALTRSAGHDARYQDVLYELNPDQFPEGALPIRVTAYRDAEQPDQCLLEVTVALPGERWPILGGRNVTLQVGNDRRTVATDAWGVAPFADIAIARLGEVSLQVGLAR